MITNTIIVRSSARTIWLKIVACLAAVVTVGGCASSPKSFPMPEDAVNSLVAALKADDQGAMKEILGGDADALLSSGDEVADANGRAEFLRLYEEKHALKHTEPDSMTLEIGASDWPLPIPIVKGNSGWYFDTAAGLDEMLSRRIGRNELSAIQVCLAIHDAEREFVAADHDADGLREYARSFRSTPGKKDGLYWPAAPGEPESPLGELVAEATAESYVPGAATEGPRPYHGYYYRILTAQGDAAPGGAMNYMARGHMIGGFGVIAWPAQYANSGLKSFIVSHHGIVYEKDLGDDTDRIARAMIAFNPDAGWVKCEPVAP